MSFSRAMLVTIATATVLFQAAAWGSIIDDRSQFVGDFTVIDFETSDLQTA